MMSAQSTNLLQKSVSSTPSVDATFLSILISCAGAGYACSKDRDWETFYDGGIEEIISTRRLVHIIKAFQIFGDKAKAIQVCLNRFDDETKQVFMELYDKVDSEFQMPSEK